MVEQALLLCTALECAQDEVEPGQRLAVDGEFGQAGEIAEVVGHVPVPVLFGPSRLRRLPRALFADRPGKGDDRVKTELPLGIGGAPQDNAVRGLPALDAYGNSDLELRLDRPPILDQRAPGVVVVDAVAGNLHAGATTGCGLEFDFMRDCCPDQSWLGCPSGRHIGRRNLLARALHLPHRQPVEGDRKHRFFIQRVEHVGVVGQVTVLGLHQCHADILVARCAQLVGQPDQEFLRVARRLEGGRVPRRLSARWPPHPCRETPA